MAFQEPKYHTGYSVVYGDIHWMSDQCLLQIPHHQLSSTWPNFRVGIHPYLGSVPVVQVPLLSRKSHLRRAQGFRVDPNNYRLSNTISLIQIIVASTSGTETSYEQLEIR